uniref:BTB_2 domain-containing protein n=1 Tax=Strongyloides venezuelensis TaxID=75913 RepID=A0A0K0G2E7_STRVS
MSEESGVRRSSRTPKPMNKMIQFKDNLKDSRKRNMKDYGEGSMKHVSEENTMNYGGSHMNGTEGKENFVIYDAGQIMMETVPRALKVYLEKDFLDQ